MSTDLANAKQELFVKAYCRCRNATRAAIEAGYSDNEKSAQSQGSRLMARPEVRFAIKAELERVHQAMDLTAEVVLRELVAIAKLDPADMLDEFGQLLPIQDMPEHVRRAIRTIKVDEDHDLIRKSITTHTKEVQAHDKIAALRLLADILKMIGQSQQVNVQVNLGDRLLAARQRALSVPADAVTVEVTGQADAAAAVEAEDNDA